MDLRQAYEKHPEDYYMSREVEVSIPRFNPQGHITGYDIVIQTKWDVEVQIETGYPAGTAVLTRRCKWVTQPAQGEPGDPDYVPEVFEHGYQRIEASPDTVAVRAGQELHLIDWIYQTWVHGEIWNETFSYWERPLPVTKESHILYEPIYDRSGVITGYTDKIIGVEYIADYGSGNYLKTIVNYNWFTGIPNKYTYELYWPGAKKRVFTQTQVYNQDHFNLDLSDFDGPYDLTPGAVTDIIYYPDGVTEDYCIVDPYLGVDEQANWIDVACDGYVARVHTGTATAVLVSFYNPALSTQWFDFTDTLYDGSNNNYLSTDPNRVTTIIENTPNRVKIRIKGIPRSGAGYFANCNYVEIIFTFYLDKYVVDFEVDMSAQTTITQWTLGGGTGVVANLTNESNIHESAGAEVDPGSYVISTGDYIGFTANEVNVTQHLLELVNWTLGNNIDQYLAVDGQHHMLITTNVPSGNSRIRLVYIVDSAEREGAAQIYNSTDRLAMGDQYKDPILDQAPSKGDDVTDMILPARIALGTLHADGAHFYEPDSGPNVKIALDRTRIRPVFVIEDFPFQSGTLAAPVDHLLCHLKCNENAASPVLNDETANNADGSWTNISNGSPRNTNTPGDSILDSIRGRALYTQDGSAYIEMVVGAGTVHNNAYLQKGSIMMRVKPQFPYNVADYQDFHFMKYNDFNFVELYYDVGSDRLVLAVVYANVTHNAFGPVYTSNYELQRYMTILSAWDADKDFAILAIDGKVVGKSAPSSTPVSNEPIEFYIAAYENQGRPNDIIIDDIKTFDEAILPFGAFYTDEVNSFANPHSDIMSFIKGDESNNSALKIGTGNISVNTPYGTDQRDLANSAFNLNVSGDVVSIPSSGNFDNAGGIIAFWFKSNVPLLDNSIRFLFGHNSPGNAPGELVIEWWDNNRFYFHTTDANSNQHYLEFYPGDFADVDIQTWNYWKCVWDSANPLPGLSVHLALYINTIRIIPTTSIAADLSWTPGTPPVNQGIGCDYNNIDRPARGLVSDFTILDNIGTPEIWTAFGKPLHVPLVDKT